MDQLTILTWAIGGGFAGTWAMMFFMFNNLNKKMDAGFEQVDKRFEQVDKRFEQVENRIDRLDARLDRLENRLEKLEEKVTDIDRRLCRIEGAMTTSYAFIHEKPKVA
mgnify:CR=1 FL=1